MWKNGVLCFCIDHTKLSYRQDYKDSALLGIHHWTRTGKSKSKIINFNSQREDGANQGNLVFSTENIFLYNGYMDEYGGALTFGSYRLYWSNPRPEKIKNFRNRFVI